MRSETMTMIEQRDEASDDLRIPVFIDKSVQREICQRYRRGALPEALAQRYGLDVARVRELLARVRYQQIKSLPPIPVPNDEFRRATAARDEALLAPAPPPEKPPLRVLPSAGLPSYIQSLYDVPLLTREQEVHLFRKLNYLKFKALEVVVRVDPRHPDHRLLDLIDQFHQQSNEVRNEIIRANLRLVVATVRRYSHRAEPLSELVSDGNISLMRAVEKFDYARGFRFSTYATTAIIRGCLQSNSRAYRDSNRFRNAHEEVLRTVPDQRANQQAEETAQVQREKVITLLLEQLDDRERHVISYRFGLDSDREPMTLKDVGTAMGVSKERIRQIQVRAIAKLRRAAME